MKRQNQLKSLVMKTYSTFIASLLFAQFSVADMGSQAAFEQQMSHIQEVSDSLTAKKKNDLEQYEKFATNVLNEWQDSSSENVARLTQLLCQTLTTKSFDGDRQYSLARKLALTALKQDHIDQIPVTLEIDLVQHVFFLTPKDRALTQEEFGKQRLKDAHAWLHAWERFVSTYDPNWEPDDTISVHPEPPPGVVNFDSGATPQSIKDPVLRAQYERAVEEHQQLIQAQTTQHLLRNRYKPFLQKAELYLIKLYSLPPSDPKQLKQLLEDYNIDTVTADRVLKAVTEND